MNNKTWALLCSVLLLVMWGAGCNHVPSDAQAATQQTDSGTPAAGSGAAPAPFAQSENSDVQAPHSQPVRRITIPDGTPVTIRMQSSVSSANAVVGDEFDAVLDGPLAVGGRTIVPAGAPVRGRVVAVTRSGRLKTPGMLEVSLASITVHGEHIPVTSTAVMVRAGSHKKRDWAMIGGGSGGGALIGALAGGGKGALIGGLVGAGAGSGAAYATGKKDVGFHAEEVLTFRLRQPIVVH